MWWVSTQRTGGSARGLMKLLGLGSYRTAWVWLHKLRRAMVRPGREKLTGAVEVDDAFVGGEEEGAAGRGSEKKARIVVAVEVEGRRLGRTRIRHVPDFSGSSLIPFVQDHVEPGSEVRTDAWKGYTGLQAKGYRHRVRVIGRDPKRASQLLPHVHRVTALLKRWLLGTHQGAVSHKHLQRYLDEFAFRFNRRKSRHVGKIFYRTAQQAMVTGHAPYRDLVAGPPVGRRRRRAPLRVGVV
jgi:transposase-like protein